MKGMFYLLIILALVGEGYLLLTGSEVRYNQRAVAAGEPTGIAGVAPLTRDVLLCNTFNGRGVNVRIFDHDVDGLNGGTASCKWLFKGKGELDIPTLRSA